MSRKPLFLFLFFLIVLTAVPLYAQDDTTTTTTTTSSTVSILSVTCSDRAVVNFSGTLLSGDALYYQMFAGSQGTGEALTSLRRASVSGAYAFSDVLNYNEGKTIGIGGYGSLYVSLSVDGQPENSSYSEYIDDIQDGCSEPQNVLATSTETDGTVVVGDGATTGTSGPAIASPFGGYINTGYVPFDPAVKEAAGASWVPPRQSTAGMIFAECNGYPMAEPGLLYDTDSITIFWSWYAATEDDMQAHLDNALYDVKYHDNPLTNVVRTPIEKRGSNYWVFWYAQVGNRPPGYHHISYQLNWEQAISDGYENFGPGTSTEQVNSSCSFIIRQNPEGTAVQYSTWPFDDVNPWPIPNWPETANIVPRPTETTE